MGLAKLVRVEAYKPRTHILINRNPFMIGRSSECDLILDHSGISKTHARILFDGEDYVLEDLQSKNGTFVNASKIERHVLQENDFIGIGSVDLFFSKVRQEERASDLDNTVQKFRLALRSAGAMRSHQLVDPILNEIMDGLMRLTQAERGFLLIEGETGELEMARSSNIDPDSLKEEESRLSQSAIEKAIETRESVAISDAQSDPFFGDKTSVIKLALKTLVCVPIVLEGKTIGILYADSNRKEQEFTRMDVEVLESLAENAAIAIQNVRFNQQMLHVMKQASDVLKELDLSGNIENRWKESIRSTLDTFQDLKKKISGE